MSSGEDVVCIREEVPSSSRPHQEKQSLRTNVHHPGPTGTPATSPGPPFAITGTPLSTLRSPRTPNRGTTPLVPVSPTGMPHVQQIQALNLLLQTQQLQAVVASGARVPRVGGKGSPGVRGEARRKVVLEREVKPSEEQEEINKMAKEEVHQTTRWGEGGGACFMSLPSPTLQKWVRDGLINRLQRRKRGSRCEVSSSLSPSSSPSKEVFSTYKNKNPAFAAARPHPADIVEAASLAVSDTLLRPHCSLETVVSFSSCRTFLCPPQPTPSKIPFHLLSFLPAN